MVADERNVRDRTITAYLAMGATATVAYFVLPDAVGSVIWAVIAFSAPVAIVVGIRRFRPERPAPWYFLAAGLCFYALGDVLWNMLDGGTSVAPGVAAYAVGYPLMALGCLYLVRSDWRTLMLAMADALVGAVGLAVILWVVVLSNGAEASGPTFSTIVSASYPVLDILLLVLLVRLTMAERTPEPAFRCLVAGFTLLLAADLAYLWLTRSTPTRAARCSIWAGSRASSPLAFQGCTPAWPV